MHQTLQSRHCLCQQQYDHRLTKPSTPKTNGMVERVNGIIKNGTILKENYDSLDIMKTALSNFLVYYLLYRRHGSLRKELKVKTPFEAIKKWYQLKPEIFTVDPDIFYQKILDLNQINETVEAIQPCET